MMVPLNFVACAHCGFLLHMWDYQITSVQLRSKFSLKEHVPGINLLISMSAYINSLTLFYFKSWKPLHLYSFWNFLKQIDSQYSISNMEFPIFSGYYLYRMCVCVYNWSRVGICLRKQSKSKVQDAFFKNSHQIQQSFAKYLNILAWETDCMCFWSRWNASSNHYCFLLL